MLNRLTKKLRWRAAVAVTVFYALCTIAPGLALAFADASTLVHCLSDDHRGAEKSRAHAHDHEDGLSHSHADDGASPFGEAEKDKGTPANCCGIFCITALPASLHLAVGEPVHGSALTPALHDRLTGRGPDRINRPPIVSLSL